MSYWWQNPITRIKMLGSAIVRVNSEGCQALGVFDWVGKVINFEKGTVYNGTDKECDFIVIKIIKHNKSYSDSRDGEKEEIFKYPLVNADIQNVVGVWMLFT